MTIDVSKQNSPGWWLNLLARELAWRNRKRFNTLADWYAGDPPLPEGAENAKRAYQAFQKKARTNFAELIVDAVLDRMQIRAIRTAADADQIGDDLAWKIHRTNGLKVGAKDVHQRMLNFGRGYVMVGDPDQAKDLATEFPIISVEDPRHVITAHHPIRKQVVIAAAKILHDETSNQDVAYLYVRTPGGGVTVHRAFKQRTVFTRNPRVSFDPGSWDWDESAGGADGKAWTATKRVPVVEFLNKDGVGEFERHTDLLERINHQILQRMVIATMQAFRQRAVKGLPDVYPEDHPKAGQEIDYDELFVADPGALWQLPLSAEMWESGQIDLRPILDAVKDDVLHLAAVTRTPLPMFTPDAVTQSAEGASAAREGHVFKIEDRNERAEEKWADVYSLVFEIMNDEARMDVHSISIEWAPAERHSLTEKAAAAVQAATAGVPWETRQAEIWDFTPDEISRQKTQRADDMLLAQAAAAAQAAAQVAAQPPAPTPVPVLAPTAA
ncbi:MAG: phage portal protein [Frankiales bacterium]|nr:phage portal protein [Frankiales bacterium]